MTAKRDFYYCGIGLLVLLSSAACVHLGNTAVHSTAALGQELKLDLMVDPQQNMPCLASLMGPPSEGERCSLWNDNIDGAPSYDASRRLVFVGAQNSYLYVLDADDGRVLAQIPTSGRVVTNTLFDLDQGLLYFGTDKGVVSAYDAFSYKHIFSFQADSKINNDLLLEGNELYFSTGVATVYALSSRAGNEKWRVERSLALERLRLTSNSSLSYVAEEKGILVAPHPDGYLSLLDSKSGELIKEIILSSAQSNKVFPDIVAPIKLIGSILWVASYSGGLVAIDIKNWQIKEKVDIAGIQQLAFKDDVVFAATKDSLYALKSGGLSLWQNNFFQLKTKVAQQSTIFERKNEVGKRVFLG
ncbi:MAG: PQQ-like beta-propeller repeat protein, partial [Myxococcales bacterium]|nr:PQQ-like beta-propeller repeat protein [Myxococcales bacterium]